MDLDRWSWEKGEGVLRLIWTMSPDLLTDNLCLPLHVCNFQYLGFFGITLFQ